MGVKREIEMMLLSIKMVCSALRRVYRMPRPFSEQTHPSGMTYIEVLVVVFASMGWALLLLERCPPLSAVAAVVNLWALHLIVCPLQWQFQIRVRPQTRQARGPRVRRGGYDAAPPLFSAKKTVITNSRIKNPLGRVKSDTETRIVEFKFPDTMAAHLLMNELAMQG